MSADFINQAINILGSQVALARAVGVQRQAVSGWASGRYLVPVKHCPKIEKVVARKVTCEQLRPDFDWSTVRSSSDSIDDISVGVAAPDAADG